MHKTKGSGVSAVLLFLFLFLVTLYPVIYLEFPWWALLLVVAGVYFLPDIFVAVGSLALYIWALVVAFRVAIGLFEILLFIFAGLYFLYWILNVVSSQKR